jgi:2-polyprenyl-3-methyl-5-hydroxy-6-metoxy-1,4-benzoquinol methylase
LRQRNDIDGVIATLLSRLSSKIESRERENIPTSLSRTSFDPLVYTYFEDQFRGSFDLISDRQKQLVRAVVNFAGTPRRWLDIGCGRGELLSILKDSGIESLGLEPNEYSVNECRSRGLEIIPGSTAHLETLDLGAPFDVVSMMQVGEHLDIQELIACVQQISSRLAPDGLLILEFPNICNPNVMVADFWLDPTHLRPLHPRLVEFILTYAGLFPLSNHDATELGTLLWSSSDATRGLDALVIGRQTRK